MRLDTNGYYALGLPLYAAIVLAELGVARRRAVRVYTLPVTIGNVAAGVGEVVLGLVIGPALLALYDLGYAHFAVVEWPPGSIVPWVLAFVLGDLCYYVYHRAGHEVAALWAIHGVHHQCEEMNVSVALRHPWLSDLYSAPFYAPLPIAGVPPGHFFVAISVISFYALTVHSRFFHRPSLGVFVTPASHLVHHAKNARYRGRNLGAMFTVWDRLFGTHAALDPAEPAILGTADGYRTHDGALAQWLGFADLLAAQRQARTLRDKIRVWTGHPGWLPPGAARRASVPARADVPDRTARGAALLLAVTVAGAAWLLWWRNAHAPGVLFAGALGVLASLAGIGALLDGRLSRSRGAGAARTARPGRSTSVPSSGASGSARSSS